METNKEQTLDLVHDLADALRNVDTYDHTQKQEIAEHLGAIEECIITGKTPGKYQFDELIKAVGGQAPIIDRITVLSQRFGYLPSL